MERFFNTAGPIKPEWHYHVPTDTRWDYRNVVSLIQQSKYFILHAPRQTGKTSGLLSLMHYLNQSEQFEALYANIEPAQAAREDVPAAMAAIAGKIASRHELYHNNNLLSSNWNNIYEKSKPHQVIEDLLTFWTKNASKPTILFLDEVDTLIGDTLISLLRQLRAGYDKRPEFFPQSIILCGVRDIRDYRIHSSRSKEIITGGSAFNIKAESLRLSNFTKDQIAQLYQQHTDATGQLFEEGIVDMAWHYTEGQPWLVNAIAYEATFRGAALKDRTLTITKELFADAKEELILRRDTHLDQLVDKLQEARVRRIIEPILSGTSRQVEHHPDDVQYVRDLGLIHVERNGAIRIANAIYKEVIPRELAWTLQTAMPIDAAWYIRANGSIDMHKLLAAFQDFFRKNAEHWLGRYDYAEAGPQLLLQAYLQRVVNGGGRIEREYSFGSRRTDLFVEYFYGEDQKQEIVIELKILRNSLESTIEEGMEQTKAYMDKCGTKNGHLLIFDRRKQRTWEEKIWKKEIDGVWVWGA